MDFFTTQDTELSEFHFFIFSLFCLCSSICKNPFRYNFDSFWKTGFIWNAYWKTALRQSFWACTICTKYEKNTNNKQNTKILERNTHKKKQ